MVVETEWMAAAETRMPTATKALAEREASMDGAVAAYPDPTGSPRKGGRPLPAHPWRCDHRRAAGEAVAVLVADIGGQYRRLSKIDMICDERSGHLR